MSEPNTLCVGARHCLCLCRGPARSLCRGPVAPCRSLCQPRALSLSGPGALCVGPRRCPALSMSGLTQRERMARHRDDRGATQKSDADLDKSAGPRHKCRAQHKRAPGLDTGPRHKDCRAPTQRPPGPDTESTCHFSGPALICVHPSAPIRVPPIDSRATSLAAPPALIRVPMRAPSSDPRATHIRFYGPPAPDPRATHPAAGRQLRCACHPSNPARSLFPGENPHSTAYCMRDAVILGS